LSNVRKEQPGEPQKSTLGANEAMTKEHHHSIPTPIQLTDVGVVPPSRPSVTVIYPDGRRVQPEAQEELRKLTQATADIVSDRTAWAVFDESKGGLVLASIREERLAAVRAYFAYFGIHPENTIDHWLNVFRANDKARLCRVRVSLVPTMSSETDGL
jgi:hypothetical protein